MSPSFIIYRMQKIIETYGIREAQSNRRFKREREAWASAIWALGVTERDQREYWVEIETKENTPDTKVHRLDQSTGHNNIQTYKIEVVDWEEHVDDLMQIIQQKCARAYPPDFGLLILGRSGKAIDPDAVIEAIRCIRVPFAEIWIVGRALEDLNRVQMVRLFPDRADVPFDLGRALNRAERQMELMQPEGRGTGTDIHLRGDIYLPIP